MMKPFDTAASLMGLEICVLPGPDQVDL